MKTQVKIAFAEVNRTSEAELSQLTELINTAYDEAEKGIWKPGKIRISKDELKELIAANEMAIAKKDNDIVGSICIHKVSSTILEFRILTSAQQYRGTGIGTKLVDFIEDWALNNGYQKMQLIVIKPSAVVMQSKAFLEDWYTRLGYTLLARKKAAEVIPTLEILQAVDCDFDIYRKSL